MTHSVLRSPAFWLALMMASLMACRPAPPTEPSTPPKWGTTRVAVRNNLTWPYRLQEVHVAIDGVVLFRRRGAQIRGSWLPVGDLPLDPGDHSVSTHMVVHYLGTPLEGNCQVELRWSQGFRVNWRPAVVDLDLALGDVTREFGERVDLSVKLKGAMPIAHQAVPHPRHEVAVPDNVTAMMRSAEARLESARQRRDVVQIACYDRKLGLLRSLAHRYDERRMLFRETTDDHEREHHEGVLRVIDRRMTAIWTQMNRCVGGDGQHVEALAKVVVGISCTETAPLESPEASNLFDFSPR